MSPEPELPEGEGPSSDGTRVAPSVERRRAPRARFQRDAMLQVPPQTSPRLERVGHSVRGRGTRVRTTSVSMSGAGLDCADPLIEDADVVLEIEAPDGTRLRVNGVLVNVRRTPDGGYHAGMNFYDEQPLLSALRVDLASFGA